MPDLRGVNSDLQVQNPQVSIEINRDKAHSLGVSAGAIEDALDNAYGARQISTIYAPNNEYWVIMELEPQYQSDPGTLSLLYVRSSSGELVPLDTLVKFTRTLGPLQINHSGQLPSATISFDVAPGVSLGKALGEVHKLAAETLPDSITTNFQGTAQAFEASLSGLGVLLLMTILVIYLVLGVLYESFIHPITILSGLPSAGLGALLTLWIFGMELDLFAFVGVIMLVGLVKKNAIMMIDFALDAQRTEGKSPAEAIFEGCIIRFRPIMMTTMAALMGTLPIAIGLGAGGSSRRPLGVAVVGGLFFSQFLTLYITPVFYTYMEAFLARYHAWRAGEQVAPALQPATKRHRNRENRRRPCRRPPRFIDLNHCPGRRTSKGYSKLGGFWLGRFVAIVASACAIAALFSSPIPAQDEILNGSEAAMVKARVQKIRELKLKAEVPVTYLTVEETESRFRTEFAKQISQAEIDNGVEENKMIGLYPPDLKIERKELADMTLELAGFYDNHHKDIVIIDRPITVASAASDIDLRWRA